MEEFVYDEHRQPQRYLIDLTLHDVTETLESQIISRVNKTENTLRRVRVVPE